MADLSQAWTVLLDKHVPNTRVVTLGMIGAAPQQYLRVLETYGLELSPKLVIVGLFMGNDMRDAEIFGDWWTDARNEDFRNFRAEENTPHFSAWLAPLVRKTYIGQMLNDLRRTYQEGRFLAGKTIDLESGERVQIVPRFLIQNASMAVSGEPGFDLVIENLTRIKALAESNGASCLVLLFPRKEEVYGQFTDEELPCLSTSVTTELKNGGVQYLDLGPVFRERALEGKALFLEVDGHPTALGYALIAHKLNEYLMQHESEFNLDWDSTPFPSLTSNDQTN